MAARIRVVLVEDNDVFRQALELLLGLAGPLYYPISARALADTIAPSIQGYDERIL